MEKEKVTPTEEQVEETTEISELDAVKAELEALKKEKDELNDRFLRTLAEYENYRKRTQREKDAIYGDATADAVKKLLPILDSFDRASNYQCQDEEFKKGIDLIGNSIKEAFTNMGIEEIPAMDQQFDPNFHDAMMHIDNPAYGENIITDVYRKGYTLNGKVIRCSMVIVAN